MFMAISNRITLLLYLQCFVLVCAAMTHTTNITRDQSALLKFKSQISDPEGHLEDWNPNRSVCEWSGVTCGVKHKRLVALEISGMSLGGMIPPEFGNMSFLQSLQMGGNYLTGTIPRELVNLRRLRLLNLAYNNFSGNIPVWMGSLSTKLQHLYLSHNNFSGSLMPSLFNLTNLVKFRIGDNSLEGDIPQQIGNLKQLTLISLENNNLSGSIPNTIYNLSILENIYLIGNNLSGSIPPDLCHYAPRLKNISLGLNKLVGRIPPSLHQCSKLQFIDLSYNNLTGPIPDFIWNLTMLQTIQIESNQISGELPEEMFNLQQLKGLYLNDNSFTGVIPKSVSNCSMLIYFLVYGNHLTGSIPNSKHGSRGGSAMNELSVITSLTKCQHLKDIDMSYNPLSSFLPKSIGNLSSSLQSLVVEDSEIHGIIPDEIGNLTHLLNLDLSSNILIGFIPRAVNGLQSLEQLYLFENSINGSIQTAICDLPALGILDLQLNQITGEIPTCLGSMRYMRMLILSDNLLESSIPSSLWNLKDLLQLFLERNRLEGALPNELGNLVVLYDLDLSSNRFSGKLPTALEKLVSLQGFDLSNNSLEGSIPESFGKMISLKSLDLSNNNLEGSIPYSLTSLQELEHFNVSNNKLVGEIPNEAPFVKFNASSFAFNQALCGSPQYHVPPCAKKSLKRSKKRKVSWWLSVILGISSTLVVLVLATLVWKHKKRSTQLPVVEMISLPTIVRVSYYELLQATGNFSESNLLGRGSFGSVYKGVLNDGTTVAIKIFNLQATGALESFDAECEVLRNLRHRNLTKVITSCSNNDDFKALVLEYIPNGSLEKCLHDGSCFLDILQRLNVMVDVAHALEYLHYGFSSTIVHCDIKPSNVLLDADMMARLSDFGLTRFLNEDSFTYTSTLATLGYIAPEYGSEGLVSRAGDVYSFGILMIETFTKRKPSDQMFKEDLSLKEWVHKYFHEDQLVLVIDSELLSENERTLNLQMQILHFVFELALNCCVDSLKERMNIKDVRVALEKMKIKYETSCSGGRT